MAWLTPDPSAIGQMVAKTAAAKAALAVSQSMSPKLVRDVQRVLETGAFVENLLGIGDTRDLPMGLLGGLTLRQAQAVFEQSSAMRVARKNLFFIRVKDRNPSSAAYVDGTTQRAAAGQLGESRIGPSLGAAVSSVSSAVNTLGAGIAGQISRLSGQVGAAVGGSNSVADIAVASFDLLALDVSYGDGSQGDMVQIGTGFMDRVTGATQTELQITTMDDEAGTLKRWFDAKLAQMNHPDGTIGLPDEYAVDIEIVHAIASGVVQNAASAYSKRLRLRPASAQNDLSRRDQALSELQMTFAQLDSWVSP